MSQTTSTEGPGLAGLGTIAADIRQLVADGQLTQAEAEGVLQTFLDRNAPEEAGEVTANRIRQMDKGRRKLVQGIVKAVGDFRQARMDRARAGLLAISDQDWEAAGGTVADAA